MGDRPNILLITSDQQHWSTLGCLNPEIDTPHLDRLADAGTLFERAYCPNPTCTPTRASMITGKYPSQHGAWSLGTKLSEAEHTVGEDFQAAGYRTSLVGKAHFQPLQATEEFSSLESYPILQDLDFWRDFSGPFYGFERVCLARNHADEAHVGQHYALWMEEQGRERVNEVRVREAADTGAGTACTACPFCIQMFDAGVGTVQMDREEADRLQVWDVAQVLQASVAGRDRDQPGESPAAALGGAPQG